MEKIDLSIIVLSYNTKELLRQCLESLVRGVGDIGDIGGVEVIVVDNGSTDGSVETARELIKKYSRSFVSGTEKTSNKEKVCVPQIRDNSKETIKLIENRANLGFAKGNNIGLKEARGEYILFLNSDTEVFPGALAEAVVYMKEHPEVGALSAKTMLISGKMDPDCHRGFPNPWASIAYFLGLEKLFPKSKLFGQYHKFYFNLNENHEIDAGAGAFMLVSKKVIDNVGNWDEKYFFYGEDLDFYYRIKKAGYKVMFYAKPLLKHYKGASSGLRKETKDIAKNSKENRIRVAKASVEAMEIFYRKFYKDIYPNWLTFLVLAAIKVKGFFRVIKHCLR